MCLLFGTGSGKSASTALTAEDCRRRALFPRRRKRQRRCARLPFVQRCESWRRKAASWLAYGILGCKRVPVKTARSVLSDRLVLGPPTDNLPRRITRSHNVFVLLLFPAPRLQLHLWSRRFASCRMALTADLNHHFGYTTRPPQWARKHQKEPRRHLLQQATCDRPADCAPDKHLPRAAGHSKRRVASQPHPATPSKTRSLALCGRLLAPICIGPSQPSVSHPQVGTPAPNILAR